MIEYKIHEKCLEYFGKGMDLKTIIYQFGEISDQEKKIIKDIYFDECMVEILSKRRNIVYYNVIPKNLGIDYMDDFLDNYMNEKIDDVFVMNRIKPREFKNYIGEKNIFLYNFTGEKSDYRGIWRIMEDGCTDYFYLSKIPCIWEEVQIASPLPPEILQDNMAKAEQSGYNFEFFMRRVDFVVFHYQFEINHEKIYRKYIQKSSEYIGYVHIVECAIRNDKEYADYVLNLKLK